MKLRPYRTGDAQYIVSWAQDKNVFDRWSAGRFGEYPLTAERLDRHYRDAFEGEMDFFAFTATDDEGVPVGHLIMRNPGDSREQIRFGFVIVDSERRGQGTGRQMLELAKKYAFEIYGALSVDLGVFCDNVSAYRCYRAIGMHETGVEYEIDGKRCMTLEITAEEFFC